MNKWIYIFISVLLMMMMISIMGYDYWERQPQVQIPFQLESASAQVIVCTDQATKEKIKGMMLEALDEALRQHIVHMFEIWMKDDRGQPERARNGTVNGINAYIKASQGVTAWAPPDCPG